MLAESNKDAAVGSRLVAEDSMQGAADSNLATQ
jgi:hypothetical protein